ncbi:MAG: DNA repair protein RecO [Arachidicoccus sp.]|nr:DNA repair protein RecO [Arachidicoccus sp.]
MLSTYKTKGIVLRTVKYGDTSIIATVYTALFGMQSYLVKGVRKGSKNSSGKINFFQPGAMLELVVYKNPFKELQFIKEYQWSFLYDTIFYDVTRNAVALYIIELVLYSIKEEESHNELFYFFENILATLDKCSAEDAANIPLFFTLQLAKFLGFQIHGKYSQATPFLDLEAGTFAAEKAGHNFILEDKFAEITSELNLIEHIDSAQNLRLNHFIRRELLKYYQQFFSLHLQNKFEIKSLSVLQSVLQ